MTKKRRRVTIILIIVLGLCVFGLLYNTPRRVINRTFQIDLPKQAEILEYSRNNNRFRIRYIAKIIVPNDYLDNIKNKLIETCDICNTKNMIVNNLVLSNGKQELIVSTSNIDAYYEKNMNLCSFLGILGPRSRLIVAIIIPNTDDDFYLYLKW